MLIFLKTHADLQTTASVGRYSNGRFHAMNVKYRYIDFGPDEDDRPKRGEVKKEDDDFDENYSDLEGGNKEKAITESEPDPDFLE